MFGIKVFNGNNFKGYLNPFKDERGNKESKITRELEWFTFHEEEAKQYVKILSHFDSTSPISNQYRIFKLLSNPYELYPFNTEKEN